MHTFATFVVNIHRKHQKTKQHQIKNSTVAVQAYEEKYNTTVVKNVAYAPDFFCNDCSSALIDKRTKRKTAATPMVWKEPRMDHSNCYACLLPDLALMRAQKFKLEYSDHLNASVQRPVFSSVPERSPQPAPLTAITSLTSQSSQSA